VLRLAQQVAKALPYRDRSARRRCRFGDRHPSSRNCALASSSRPPQITKLRHAESGACFAGPHSPWSPPLAPLTPQWIAPLCEILDISPPGATRLFADACLLSRDVKLPPVAARPHRPVPPHRIRPIHEIKHDDYRPIARRTVDRVQLLHAPRLQLGGRRISVSQVLDHIRQAFAGWTRGGSRMRESRTYGSGAARLAAILAGESPANRGVQSLL
jgi:hypothetical protein